MVQQLGGHMLDEPKDWHGLLESAKRTLLECTWVGFQDTMTANIEQLAKIINTPLVETVDNVTPNRPAPEAEDRRTIDRLHELNKYDIELWQWAKNQQFSN
jgi:hypothetical protein